jgi:hypothetical protein
VEIAMVVEPIIGMEKYRWLKQFGSTNQTAEMTKDGIGLFEMSGGCIYTVGFHERDLEERIFVAHKSGKGPKSDMHALVQGLKKCLTVETMRHNRNELKLNDDRYYVIGEGLELGGSSLYISVLPFTPTIYMKENREYLVYFPATRPETMG